MKYSDIVSRAIAHVRYAIPTAVESEMLWDILSTQYGVTFSPATCRVLAERLGAAYRLVPEFDDRLQELHFGDWEGRRWSEIDRAESDPWAADYLRAAPPGGEPYEQMLVRVDAFLDDLGASFERVAIVTHAGPLRAILVRCLGLAPEAAWKLDVGYGRVTRLAQRGGDWRLEVLNA
jgi:alpha-ribazole phosphatase